MHCVLGLTKNITKLYILLSCNQWHIESDGSLSLFSTELIWKNDQPIFLNMPVLYN